MTISKKPFFGVKKESIKIYIIYNVYIIYNILYIVIFFPFKAITKKVNCHFVILSFVTAFGDNNVS